MLCVVEGAVLLLQSGDGIRATIAAVAVKGVARTKKTTLCVYFLVE